MKRVLVLVLTLVLAASMAAFAQAAPATPAVKLAAAAIRAGLASKNNAPLIAYSGGGPQAKPAVPSGTPATAQAGASLESVLARMDEAATKFKTLEANFLWDQYSKVVDEHDQQKGTIYFRRNQKGTEMMADITEPAKKYVQFADGKLRVYEPKLDQVTEYNAGKNKAAFESFLVLGFGGRGHDLQKSFEVKYGGTETVGGINTAKLELTPKSPKIHNMFTQIVLWIDLARGISVQQQFIEGPPTSPSGDYRLAKYSDVKMNQRISDDVFKLKTTSSTKVVRPQG